MADSSPNRHPARMQNSSLKFLALFLLIFISLACAKREEAPQIISTEKPEAAPTTIISNQPPREGGTVIMATAPGATPAPSVPTPPPGPTIPAPSSATSVAPVTAAAVSATVPISPPPPPVAVEIKTTSTTEKVGLLECDTYVDRYSRCLTRNVPADQRGPLVQGLEMNIRRWQGMTSSAPGRTDAGNECQRAFDQTKQAMTAYGCVWE
jgi:hypothetical protein